MISEVNGNHFVSYFKNRSSYFISEYSSEFPGAKYLTKRTDELSDGNLNCLIYAFTTFLVFFISENGVESIKSSRDENINKTLHEITKLRTYDDFNGFINEDRFVDIYKLLYELLVQKLCDYYTIIDGNFNGDYLNFTYSPYHNQNNQKIYNGLPDEIKSKLKSYEYWNLLDFNRHLHSSYGIDINNFVFKTKRHDGNRFGDM
jgi:hypothetical protein